MSRWLLLKCEKKESHEVRETITHTMNRAFWNVHYDFRCHFGFLNEKTNDCEGGLDKASVTPSIEMVYFQVHPNKVNSVQCDITDVLLLATTK